MNAPLVITLVHRMPIALIQKAPTAATADKDSQATDALAIVRKIISEWFFS